MGIWFPALELAGTETFIYRGAANLFKGRRQIGAQVTVTDQRLVVLPSRLDGLLGEKRVERALTEIIGVTVEPPGTQTARKRGLSARFRPQVEIHLADRTLAMTVGDPERLTKALQAATG